MSSEDKKQAYFILSGLLALVGWVFYSMMKNSMERNHFLLGLLALLGCLFYSIILTGLFFLMGWLFYSMYKHSFRRQHLIEYFLQREGLRLAVARVCINLEQRQLQQELHQQQQEDVEDPVAKSPRLVQILDPLNSETLLPKTDTSNHKDESRGTVENTVKAAKALNMSLLERLFSATKQEQAAECFICLEAYKDGQVLCSAKTTEGDHLFHEVCALEWLQDHPEVPLSRAPLRRTEHGFV
jgi:hypothetical protein